MLFRSEELQKFVQQLFARFGQGTNITIRKAEIESVEGEEGYEVGVWEDRGKDISPYFNVMLFFFPEDQMELVPTSRAFMRHKHDGTLSCINVFHGWSIWTWVHHPSHGMNPPEDEDVEIGWNHTLAGAIVEGLRLLINHELSEWQMGFEMELMIQGDDLEY